MPTIRTPLAPIMRTIPIAILLLTRTIPVSAQWQDYIVTLRNDTIHGNLQFRFNSPSILETEETNYAVDIRSVESWFSASHKTLARRRMLPGKKKYLFLPVLESGAISLYVYSIGGGVNGMTTTIYYAQKWDSALVQVWTNRGLFASDNKTRRQALAALITDDPAVKQTFDSDTKYDAIDVQYYIHEYNMGSSSASP
jgi:hypothetical protein